MTASFLIVTLFFLFAMNTPIAIAIGVSSMVALVAGGSTPLMVVIQRMVAGTDSFHLMAVPLFMYAGVIMEAGGISRRLIDFANALAGWLPGGLAAVTIVSAMFFAGISGSAAADTAAVGAVLIPAMKRSGYDSDFAAAVQASGGSLGVVIPPSIPMIIFGFLTGASIGQLFAAGILPGLLIGLSLIAVSTVISWRRGYAPETHFSLKNVLKTFKRAVLALGAPLIILGGILTGVFTATESAAVAVAYALFVSMVVYGEIRPADLLPLFREGGGDRIHCHVHHCHGIGVQLDCRHGGYSLPAGRYSHAVDGPARALAFAHQCRTAGGRHLCGDHRFADSAGAYDHGHAARPGH